MKYEIAHRIADTARAVADELLGNLPPEPTEVAGTLLLCAEAIRDLAHPLAVQRPEPPPAKKNGKPASAASSGGCPKNNGKRHRYGADRKCQHCGAADPR